MAHNQDDLSYVNLFSDIFIRGLLCILLVPGKSDVRFLMVTRVNNIDSKRKIIEIVSHRTFMFDNEMSKLNGHDRMPMFLILSCCFQR